MPPNERNGRRHTSFCTVAVLDEAALQPLLEIPASELRIDRMRGHGRGGQRRNKVETACRVTHLPTGLTAVRMSGRSQPANIADATADIARQLAAAAHTVARMQENAQRRQQAAPEVAFTHSAFRDEVVCHATGQRWTMRAWAQGRF